MLQIKNVSKKYITGELQQTALDGVSLNLRDNEFVAILGPSGSGKTTLLNIIGGLDRYDSGDLIINGVTTKAYKDRDWDSYRNHTIGFVFQSYNLIPHQTILANVELALTIGGISQSERRERARKALAEVGLGDQTHKKPNQLSGGQMQRVAIARALVNDPDILLADEPTGALDTETSVQVMDLLKEVAKDRLVVMVTHNPELAEEYATRIVRLRDGKIISDTDPFDVGEGESSHRNMGKSSMSFLTALALSFNNLRTKKARTILVAFAGSIGIIGIALILSLSNGVNKYIENIEEETLSEYPLQITSTSFDMSSLMMSRSESLQSDEGEGEGEKEGEVNELQIVKDMFSSVEKNDLASLKAYLDSDESHILDHAKAVEYSYNVAPLIYREDGNGVRRVNPDPTFEAYGAGTEGYSMMGFNMDMFSGLPVDENLYLSQYDVKAGRWPTSYNECVLVLSSSGNISDFTLYTLGLKDASELDKMMKAFAEGKTIDVHSSESKVYNYDDFLGIEFKLVNPSECYVFDKEFKVWTDKTEDKAFMKDLVKKSEPLTIVGVVVPSEDAKVAMLNIGIGYMPELVAHVIDDAKESALVKSQLKNRSIDVFSGKDFSDMGEDSGFDMESLFSVDESALENVFSVNTDALNITPSFGNLPNVDLTEAIDLGALVSSLPELTEEDVSSLVEALNNVVDRDRINSLAGELANGFQAYLTANGIKGQENAMQAIGPYLQTPEARGMIERGIQEALRSDGLAEDVSENVQAIIGKYSEAVSGAISDMINNVMQLYMREIESQLGGVMQQIAGSLAGAFKFDQSAMERAFQIKMTEKELQELMSSLMAAGSTTYEGNLKKLGYADESDPNTITIYPRDFESKGHIAEILDGYNEKMKSEDESKVVRYTDIVGTLMSSVTDIINAISYVLIAFVAISLVVSSIMIGVITYISVLERKKEIGILRAIGASKRNISSVFNAETFIIGLLAGLIGVGLSALILIPGNMLIHYLADTNDINAVLPIQAAVILVVLSIVLTLIGGLIPSKKAAKSDPVTALRTE